MEMKKEMPLVSVIMPAYNAGPFIEEAIASVAAQTITDWELIVIDDCSPDNTRQIIAGLAEKDARIRLLANDVNMGVAKTRNRGMDLCRGRYVAFLDSDDYWKPRMLEKMIARAEETGADIIYCSYELVDEQGAKVCNDFMVPLKTTFEESIVRSVITCSTVLITGKLAKEHRFPTNMYHEDIALWFQILRDGGTARGVTDVLAAYRQRADSRSAGKITSAKRRWTIYRKHLEMPVFRCISVMIRYGYYGLIKYKRI
jgi:teichuronic acid biosynthesis glycosyltransferase TuaG